MLEINRKGTNSQIKGINIAVFILFLGLSVSGVNVRLVGLEKMNKFQQDRCSG